MIVVASVLGAVSLFSDSARADIGAPVLIGPGVWETAGDWTIVAGDNILYQNGIIYLNGNLTIQGAGILTLEAITLQVNCTFPGEFYIEVQGGGEFHVLDSGVDATPPWDPADTDGSEIRSAWPDAPYNFYVRPDGLLEVSRSRVLNAGLWIPPGPPPAVLDPYGVFVESDLVTITESWFTDNAAAIIANNSAVVMIVDSRFELNQVGMGALAGSALLVSNTDIWDHWMLAVAVNDSALTMDMGTIMGNGFGPGAPPALIVQDNATADVTGTVIANNERAAFWVDDSVLTMDTVDILDNGLIFNEPGGVLSTNASATLTDVNVQGNGATGISMFADSRAVLTRTNVSQNADDGIVVMDAYVEVYDSWFYQNGGNFALVWMNFTGSMAPIVQGTLFLDHNEQVLFQALDGDVTVTSTGNTLQEHAAGYQVFATETASMTSVGDTIETTGMGTDGLTVIGNNASIDAAGLTVTSHDNVGVFAMAPGGTVDLVLSGSSITDVPAGQGLFAFANTNVTATLSQVDVDQAIDGGITLMAADSVTADFTDVNVSQTSNGVGVALQSGVDVTATYLGGWVTDAQDAGLMVMGFSGDVGLNANGLNVVGTFGQNAPGVWVQGTWEADFTYLSGTIDDSGGPGAFVGANGGNVTLTVEDTAITQTGQNAAGGGFPPVALFASAGWSITSASLQRNTLDMLADAAVALFASVDATANLTENSITDLGQNPMWFPTGVYIAADAGNITAELWDNVVIDNAAGSGVILMASNGNLDVNAVNNTIAGNDGLGFQAESSQLFATLDANRVDFNTFRGMHLWADLQGDVTLTDNRIVRSGENGLLLYGGVSMTASTSGTDLIANDLNGIYAENTDLTSVDDLFIANTEAAVRLWGSTLAMERGVAEFNLYGLVLEAASTAFVENSSLASDTWDFFLDGASDATTLNTTFDKGKVAYGDFLSSLLVQWYAYILVQTSQGQPIAGASVQLEDVNGVEVFNGTSDATGYVLWLIVEEYFEDSSGRLYSTPHNATASEATLGAGWTVATMDVSKTIVVGLEDLENPVAVANDDTVNEDQPIVLDSTGSSDNVGIVNYTWTFMDGGTPITLTGAFPTYVFSQPGSYDVTLTVTDGAGNSDSDGATITVLDITPPAADAGTDQTVSAGDTVTLDAAASTDNVAIVNYSWSLYEGGSLVTLTGVSPSRVFAEPGVYIVTLRVEDAEGNAATDVVIITVVDGTPPAVEDTSPRSGATGVATEGEIVIMFSETMDRASTEAAVVFGADYTAQWRSDDRVLVLTLDGPLAEGTEYTVTIGTGAQDLAGNALGTAYSFSFTTATPASITGLPEWIWLLVILILLALLIASLFLRRREAPPEEEIPPPPPEEEGMEAEEAAEAGEELEEGPPPPPEDEEEIQEF